jgi:hypothetical protein
MEASKRRAARTRSPYGQPVWLIAGGIVIAIAAIALVVADLVVFSAG